MDSTAAALLELDQEARMEIAIKLLEANPDQSIRELAKTHHLLTTVGEDADCAKRPIKPNKSSQSLRRILSLNGSILWEARGGHPESSTSNLWLKIFLKQRSVLQSLANTGIRTSSNAT